MLVASLVSDSCDSTFDIILFGVCYLYGMTRAIVIRCFVMMSI